MNKPLVRVKRVAKLWKNRRFQQRVGQQLCSYPNYLLRDMGIDPDVPGILPTRDLQLHRLSLEKLLRG